MCNGRLTAQAMTSGSRSSLESLFADSCGEAERQCNFRKPAARLRPKPRPRPRLAAAHRSVPPQRRNMTKGTLENLFLAGQERVQVRKHSHRTASPAIQGATLRDQVFGKHRATRCHVRAHKLAGLTAGMQKRHASAGLTKGRSAPPSRKKRVATIEPFVTPRASTVNNRKRPLLEDVFSSKTLACEDVACCDGSSKLARRVTPRIELHKLVGLASESTVEHRRRHPKLRVDCPRCRFINMGNDWKHGPGTLTIVARGVRKKTVWLAERAPEHGGAWGLGCVMCAALLRRLVEECGPQGRRAKQKLSTGFSRFELRCPSFMKASGFERHSRTYEHTKVVDASCGPRSPRWRF